MISRDALLQSLAGVRTDEVVVTTMGATRPWGLISDHDLDFASADSAMGHAADLALGLAMARPERRVLCLNGDGSMLMSLGTLVTIVDAGASNLILFVLDNGAYEITGGQPVPGRGSIDFAAMARAAGFTSVYDFDELGAFDRSLPEILATEGPTFVSLRTEPGDEGPISRGEGEPSRYLRSSLAEWSRQMRRALLLPLFLVVGVLSACGDSSVAIEETEEPCFVVSEPCLDRFAIVPNRFLRHYRTHDLDAGAEGVTRAIILIHGTGRNFSFNFETGVIASTAVGLRSSTSIVAPQFIISDEFPEPDEPYWTNGGWKRGHLSVTGGPTPRISSYQAIDSIIARFSDPSRFPDMEEIVLAGHSAGGQVAHRYASGGMDPVGVPVRYVVANPSTYLFARDERPAGEGFAVPDREACPNYDVWHYGLAGLNSYMSRISEAKILSNLTVRDVTIMVGNLDTGSAQLDVSCGANLQGEHRFARGLNLLRYMDEYFPGHRHVGETVIGVAHSSRGMFTSAQGLQALFR